MDELWLATGGRTVPKEWIDYNGHMMDAFYFVAFTEATEAFLDHVGLGADYRARTGSGVYTAEGHLCFLSGVIGGAALSYRTQLLGHDARRLHVFHQMTSADHLAATCELMFLHVSDGRVTPMPPAAVDAVTALAAVQTALLRPGQAGRHVGIPGRAGLSRPGCGPRGRAGRSRAGWAWGAGAAGSAGRPSRRRRAAGSSPWSPGRTADNRRLAAGMPPAWLAPWPTAGRRAAPGTAEASSARWRRGWTRWSRRRYGRRARPPA